MAGLNFKHHKINKILCKNGFKLVRTTGDHKIYKRGEDETISIPCSDCNGLILQRLFREFDIKF